ncbi:MAG: metallophosphoesterase family protein [Aestuariivirgaceae bacterium]
MFQLAHLSDPHLGPLPSARLSELLNKRLSGYLSWHLSRRKIHTPRALQLVLEDIRAHKPDHVALTGDLVNIGLPSEYENAHRWLEQFGPPDWITFVPGNHDAYITHIWRHGIGKWRSYFTGDMRISGVSSSDENLQFPFVRQRRYVAMIGVSSAIASGVGRAWGELGNRQIEDLRATLAETRRRGFYRVLLIHHPPLAGLCPPRKSLLDAKMLLPVLEAEGAELVLFGHNHEHHHIELPSANGPVHLFGVPSASLWPAAGTTAAWNLYGIRRQERSWLTNVTIRALDGKSGSMVTLSTMQLEHRRMIEVEYNE